MKGLSNSVQFYVATKYENKEQARVVAHQIEMAFPDSCLVARWMDDSDYHDGSDRLRYAIEDYEDVTNADAFILIPKATGRGHYTEFGMALGRGVPCFLWGDGGAGVFMPLAQRVWNVRDLHAHEPWTQLMRRE